MLWLTAPTGTHNFQQRYMCARLMARSRLMASGFFGVTGITMTRSSAIRIASLLLIALSFALTGAACEEPVVSDMGSPATVGGVEFELVEYDVEYLELTEGDEIFEYPDPVLTITVKLTNNGQKPLTYSPTHSAQQMSETSTPLLYPDPGGEEKLPPATKNPIPGVYLEEGRLEGQITKTQTIEPGATVEDIFIFEVPDADSADLIFSIPPSMHRANVPVLFRIPYTYKKPKGPTVYGVGDAVESGPVTFKVDSAEAEWVKTKDSAEGEGFSSEPLYKVNYEIKNTGKEPVEYEPTHRDVKGTRGATLFSSEGTYSRVRLPPTTTAVGQVQKDTELEAGDTVKDFALFEMPDEDAEQLTFEYPASQFGQNGLIRVRIPYEHSVPEKPKEIREDKDEDDEDDD